MRKKQYRSFYNSQIETITTTTSKSNNRSVTFVRISEAVYCTRYWCFLNHVMCSMKKWSVWSFRNFEEQNTSIRVTKLFSGYCLLCSLFFRQRPESVVLMFSCMNEHRAENLLGFWNFVETSKASCIDLLWIMICVKWTFHWLALEWRQRLYSPENRSILLEKMAYTQKRICNITVVLVVI